MSNNPFTPPGGAPDIDRDRWGRPLITPPQPLGAKPVAYTRATTVAKTLDDSSGLMLWKQRMTALGLVSRRDLLTAVAATDTDDKKALNRLVDQAADAGGATAAATTGTALHTFTERMDRGDDVGHVPPEFKADLAAYNDLADTIGWKVRAIEQFTVLDPYKVAGTADRVLEIDGKWYIADLKTGSSIDFHHAWAVQFAIYAHALPYDIPGRTRLPWDVVPEQDKALVIHLPAGQGKAAAHWIDIAAGWEAFRLSMQARAWRQRRALLTPWTPADPITEAIEAAATTEQLTAVWTANQTAWTAEHTQLAAARKQTLTHAA
jgi:hypothetical protein